MEVLIGAGIILFGGLCAWALRKATKKRHEEINNMVEEQSDELDELIEEALASLPED